MDTDITAGEEIDDIGAEAEAGVEAIQIAAEVGLQKDEDTQGRSQLWKSW